MKFKNQFFLKLKPVSLSSAIIIINLSSLITQANTSLRLPILITDGNSKIYQIKDFSPILNLTQIHIPKTLDLNTLTDSDEIQSIENQVQSLSNVTSRNLKLLKSAELKTYINTNLDNKLCYTGSKEIALRLFPQFTNEFFPANLLWVGYRFSGESHFKNFESSEVMDEKVNQLIPNEDKVKWLTEELKVNDIQIITKSLSSNTYEAQTISFCKN
jgi:hypothetical protein